MTTNFDIELNDDVENFTVDFGEVQRVTVDDFDKLKNRPSYSGTVMTHETNIPEVPSKVSQLQNDSDYQTGTQIQEALATKQDKLTAGTNIAISDQNVISATDTVYSAGNGINISNEHAIAIDQTVVATQQNLSDEVTNRENADIYLQGQIDAISASSDVVDIVGTYADLQNYDTSKLKDNDIVKVLQDSTQSNATTYYRWSTSTSTFTLIGQEGPYYTKASADAQFVPQTRTVNSKALSSNIVLTASDVGALGTSDVVQTTGNSTTQIMSQKATTDALATKLNASDYVVDTQLADSTNPVQNKVLNTLLADMPSDFFYGSATTTKIGTEVSFDEALVFGEMKMDGNTSQNSYTGTNLFDVETFVMGGMTNGHLDTGTIRITNITMPLKVFPNTSYTISVTLGGDVQGFRIGMHQLDANKAFLSDSGWQQLVPNPYTFTTSANTEYIGIVCSCSVTSSTVTTGSTESHYSANTPTQWLRGCTLSIIGSFTSPSPSQPETINVVSGTQTVQMTGLNRFDPALLSQQPSYNTYNSSTGLWTTNSGGNYFRSILYDASGNNSARDASKLVKLKPNTSYSLKFYDFINGTSASTVVQVASYNSLGVAGETKKSGTDFINITTDDNYYYLDIQRRDNSGTLSFSHIMIVEGTYTAQTMPDYQAYSSTIYTINLGSIELAKIGDYQDYIYKSGDDWYVHKEMGEVVLDGSEDDWKTTGTYNAYLPISDAAGRNTSPVYANYFIYDSAASEWGGIRFGNTNNNLVFPDAVRELGTLPDFKTWLSTHNTIVYYQLAAATDTKITDNTLIGQLNAVLNATPYDGETIIVTTAVSPDLPAILEIVAINKTLGGIFERLRQ